MTKNDDFASQVHMYYTSIKGLPIGAGHKRGEVV